MRTQERVQKSYAEISLAFSCIQKGNLESNIIIRAHSRVNNIKLLTYINIMIN